MADICLRQFADTDAATLLKWGQDDHYRKTAGFAHYASLFEAKTAIKQYQQRDNSYAVCLQTDDQLIGIVELYSRGESGDLAKTKEVGFLLDRDYEGHGYMTQALRVLFNYFFKELAQTQIWAGTFNSNLRAQKLLKKLGFKYIYTASQPTDKNYFTNQVKYYLLERAQWLKINKNTES
ncbi:GNAT family N-acetyltransferase [Lactobacillus sp. ESL0681]|uniref:GNAT family N-acetyltransferase n=1 Tax=Lactobacillus sp. ESL0681 TaxID=2983211 RepID=UPI0023F68C63|nr:GNAT family N-acetyltransferase [Lactobacillus sp. ESL0681]WEV39577.1 GNAT family N-acetyltransferase [Lactobacillus sp. ESL0681]